MKDTQQRIEELEAKLAFQDDALTQLDSALVAQQTRVDQLERRLEALQTKLVALESQPPGAPEGHEPPPHY